MRRRGSSWNCSGLCGEGCAGTVYSRAWPGIGPGCRIVVGRRMRRFGQITIGIGLCFALSSVEATADNCEELAELHCINSAECTLHQLGGAGTGYECKSAKNLCERGFKQKSGTVVECESKSGCVFVTQSCYCAPDVICRCGGGAPSQCRLKQ